MKNAWTYLFVLVGICMSNNIHAQTFRQFQKAGDNAYANGDFYSAMYYYEKASELKPKRSDILYQWGESARQFNAPNYAIDIYKKIEKKDRSQFPMLNWAVAKSYFTLGDYEKAKTILEKKKTFLSNGNEPYRELYQRVLWAQKQKLHSKYKNVEIAEKINSSWSEAAPLSHQGLLYYNSLKYINKENKERRLSRIYSYNNRTEQLIKLSFNGLDDNKHWSNWFVAKNSKVAFLTICDPTEDNECVIYTSSKEDGQWKNIERLPEIINMEASSNSHPMLAEWKGEMMLLFSSNRKGGQGGFDIWASKLKEDGSLDTPFNIEEVNSTEDEICPFVFGEQLYFSTNGRMGFGGYDVFVLDDGKIMNLGLPINSGFDDIHFSKNKKEIYISSNRISSKEIDRKSNACCHDIYAFKEEAEIIIDKDPRAIGKEVVAENVIEKEAEKGIATIVIEKKDLLKNKKEEQIIDVEKEKASVGFGTSTTFKSRPVYPKVKASLYFDNDYPKPVHSGAMLKDYSSLYNDYINRENVFAIKNGLNKKGETMSFFENEVKKGYQDLNLIHSEILRRLKRGEIVKIEIKGFTSPRAMNSYNLNLSKRRIISVINYLMNINNGVLKKYLSSNLLIVKHNPKGETTASKTISDKITDELGSIYDIEASRERRVEIGILD